MNERASERARISQLATTIKSYRRKTLSAEQIPPNGRAVRIERYEERKKNREIDRIEGENERPIAAYPELLGQSNAITAVWEKPRVRVSRCWAVTRAREIAGWKRAAGVKKKRGAVWQ